MKCPLNSQDIPNLKEPLEDLTADKARECVKVFEGLPYSPREADQAREIAEKISEHARLGFTQVKVSNMLSPKMREHLESRGFQVMVRYPKKYLNEDTDDRIIYDPQRTEVSWSKQPMECPEGWTDDPQTIHEGLKAKRDRYVAKNAAREAQVGPYLLLEEKSASSGCLPLVLIGLTLIAGGVLSSIFC